MLTPFSEFNFEACMKEVDVAYYEELIKQYSVSDIGPGSEFVIHTRKFYPSELQYLKGDSTI